MATTQRAVQFVLTSLTLVAVSAFATPSVGALMLGPEETVYLEIYPNGTAGNLALSTADWQFHVGATGTANAQLISLNNSAAAETPVNSFPSNPTTNSGYPYLPSNVGDRALFWTNEHTIQNYFLTRFRWFNLADGGSSTDPDSIRFAVQVDNDSWYVTDQSDAVTGGSSNSWLEREIDLSTATWQELDFTAGTALGLTGPNGLSLPIGDYTAFGVFKPAFNTTFRPDNFTIFAAEIIPPAPEPSSFLLLGLGMFGLLRQSRRRSAWA